MSASYTINKDPLSQPVQLTPPRLKNKQPAANIQGFFDLVGTALQLHLKAVGNPNSVPPIFLADDPKQRVTRADTAFDAIFYRVEKAQMANNTNDGVRKPKIMEIRETRHHPDKADYLIEVMGWREQVDVQFDIYSKDAESANRLAEWFHQFIMTWAWELKFFEGRGIENFEFLERLKDEAPRVDEQELYIRPLRYTFRLNRLFALEKRTITSLLLSLQELK